MIELQEAHYKTYTIKKQVDEKENIADAFKAVYLKHDDTLIYVDTTGPKKRHVSMENEHKCADD